jgi:pilus assembly protein CpaB
MRPKSLALLMLALGCGLVASVGLTQWMARRHTEVSNNGATQPIFVAIADVALGDILSAQALKLEQWPTDKVPPGAISKIEEIEGRRVRTRLYAGEPILANKLMGKGASEQGATSLIPKGYRVVPVRVDQQSSGSNLIMPGDRVDVMVYLTRDPNREIAETGTRTILQDIKVFAVNEVLDLEKEKDPARSINARTISLLVTPEQAAKVILAAQMGSIQLVMRSPEDDAHAENAQAKPSELFGSTASGKSERSKESLMETPAVAERPEKGRGIVDFLNSLGSKTPAAVPAVPNVVEPKPTETWTMRIIEPGSVSDVVLEADAAAVDTAAPFGMWKTTNTVTTATAATKPSPSAPPAKQAVQRPAPRPAQRPAAGQARKNVVMSGDPAADEDADQADDEPQAPLPPKSTQPKAKNALAAAIAGAVTSAMAKKPADPQVQAQPAAAAR